MAVNVAINGLGRIGRACARIVLGSSKFRLIAANDIIDSDTLRYLLRYDSVHSRSQADLSGVRFSNSETIEGCDFEGADVVLDCTGLFLNRAVLSRYLRGSVKRAIISAPPTDDLSVIAPTTTSTEAIVSAGSCTTNALFLLSKVIDEAFGFEALAATSIHSYTSDQRLLDAKHSDRRRGRAAALNIIPVTTGAAKNLSLYNSSYAAKSAAIGIRVPTPDVSLMQATFKLPQAVSAKAINEAFMKASAVFGEGVLMVAEDKVLTDIIGLHASAVVDSSLTMSVGSLVAISAWHDNEVGYAARMIDLVLANQN
ncbi:glyceraldehyde-3-phosphate dehydrogenase [Campylobacterota bacterium]|nr:glyceraldehyde-3-phosphate dehydrogenase [Campylobacterota bacterium]